jgi:hypothetical protein
VHQPSRALGRRTHSSTLTWCSTCSLQVRKRIGIGDALGSGCTGRFLVLSISKGKPADRSVGALGLRRIRSWKRGDSIPPATDAEGGRRERVVATERTRGGAATKVGSSSVAPQTLGGQRAARASHKCGFWDQRGKPPVVAMVKMPRTLQFPLTGPVDLRSNQASRLRRRLVSARGGTCPLVSGFSPNFPEAESTPYEVPVSVYPCRLPVKATVARPHPSEES